MAWHFFKGDGENGYHNSQNIACFSPVHYDAKRGELNTPILSQRETLSIFVSFNLNYSQYVNLR
jgi:hypothetical protein